MSFVPKKTFFHLSRLCLYLVGFLGVYCLPLERLMSDSICYWYTNYGLQCAMCGGTRSFLHYMHLNFEVAFSHNPALTLGLYPLLTIFVLQDLYAIIANSWYHKTYPSLLLYTINLFNRQEVK